MKAEDGEFVTKTARKELRNGLRAGADGEGSYGAQSRDFSRSEEIDATARSFDKSDTEALLKLLDDEEFIDKFIVGNQKIETAVVNSYLVGRTKSVTLMGAGRAMLAPVNKPKTLDDAKKLCDKILSQKM